MRIGELFVALVVAVSGASAPRSPWVNTRGASPSVPNFGCCTSLWLRLNDLGATTRVELTTVQ